MAARTYPPYLREKARQLRRERKLAIDELAESLALPRTTIYHWVRGVLAVRTNDTYFRASGVWIDCLKYEWLNSVSVGV